MVISKHGHQPTPQHVTVENVEPGARRRGKNEGVCPCCLRQQALSFHHLIPKKLHRRQRFRKHYTRAELALGIYVCRKCHDGIHRFHDEMVLATHINTLGLLTSDPELARYFAWVSKQK